MTKYRFHLGATTTKTGLRLMHPAVALVLQAWGEDLICNMKTNQDDAQKLATDLQTEEQGRTDRDSILRALRRCKLMLVDEIWDKKLRDYGWATNPERMGS